MPKYPRAGMLAALLPAVLLLVAPVAWAQTPVPEATGTPSLAIAHAPASTQAALAKAKPVVAEHAMVVTSQHLATKVGLDILKDGGNAVDAAVAIGYALAVVQPCCGNIGGGGFMVIHLATGENAFLDFREKAPLKATVDMYQNAAGHVVKGLSTKSYLAVGVPGTVMGLDNALAKYGSMTRAQVMAPAIKLAKDGFVLNNGDVRILDTANKAFSKWPNVAAIFLNHGKPWQAGERLVQTQLAHTLELVANNGSKAFYDGPIAKAVVKASQTHEGILSLRDFVDYTADWAKPIECNYKGYTIVSAAPPSSGGVTMCETLQIIKPYPFHAWGYGSVKSVHYLAEAERRAFADRNTYLGDPAFVHNPIDKLLSPVHADRLRASIKPDAATPSAQIKGSLGAPEGMHTTHYSIVDAHGNAVAVTYTINRWFGNKQIAGNTGFFLNNEMDDFTSKPGVPNSYGLVQGKVNQIEPGKRPLSSMSPTIVLKNGKLFMVTGSPGGSTIISTTLESILNVVDFGMNAQQAVNAPRVHQQWYPQKVFIEPGLLTDAAREKLEAMGYTFKLVPQWGAAEAIVVNPTTGVLEGANDRRRPAGLAAGY